MTAWTPEDWNALGSGATALALFISAVVFAFQLRDRKRDRRARHQYLAERISCWVEDRYETGHSGGFVRHTVVHAKNVGDQPVYDLALVVGEGHSGMAVRSLGQLGVPHVSVLAPGREEDWPIAEALKAHEVTAPLQVEATFRDPSNTWWCREFSGVLTEVKRRERGLVEAPMPGQEAEAEAQMGKVGTENPIAVAAMFCSLVTDEDLESHLADLQSLCTPESVSAWGDFSATRELLRDRGMATFPRYPAPGVAYVKFPKDVDALRQAKGPVLIEATIMTLQNRQELHPPGWRVHGVGAPFPPEALPPIPTQAA